MKILIVVDVQNDFTTGALGTAEAQSAIPAIKKKISEYAADPNSVIYFTRDSHYENSYAASAEGYYLPVLHCVKDSWGWQIVDGVMPIEYKSECYVIDKPTFGYIDWVNELEAFPEEIDSIEIIGFCTDICVVSNALILQAVVRTIFENPPAMSCDAACCAGVSPEKHLAALEIMKSCQIKVINE